MLVKHALFTALVLIAVTPSAPRRVLIRLQAVGDECRILSLLDLFSVHQDFTGCSLAVKVS